jgi:surface antigen
MHRRRLVAVVAVLLIVALAGCEAGGMRMGPGTASGGLGGAAAGGLLGAALGGGSTGIASGVLIGGLLGAGVGQMLDQRSQQMQSQTVSRALETSQSGTTTSWTNPDNGNRGTVTPLRTFRGQDGNYCREFQQSVVIEGQNQQLNSTACRQPDGSWRTQG